jgi:hypothetical protein
MASSLSTIVLTAGDMSADALKSVINFAEKKEGTLQLADFITSMAAGVHVGSMSCRVGATQATGAFTITSTGPANNETAVLAGQTLTAKTSGAVVANGEFNRSDTPATAAANLAATINAVASLVGVVTATAAAGVVTLTASVPGLVGNGLILTEAMANTTVTAFSGGTNGTVYTLDNA